MGISRTVSEINGDFSRKSLISPHPRVYCAPSDGLSLEFGIGARGQKTRVMGLPGRTRSLTTSSAVWIQSTNVTDGQTDGHTPDDSKDRAYA